MEKVLVTGANGFIGSHLVEALLKNNFAVRALVRKYADLRWLAGLPIEIVNGAITEYNTILPAVENVDYICHTAGATKANSIEEYALVNYGGTENLLNACIKRNPNLKKFVLFSSLSVVGPPETSQSISEDNTCYPASNYGTTKLQAESAVLEFKDKIPSVILRLCAIFGPRDKETLFYFKFLKKGIRPVFGGNFSVCYVKDAVRAAVLCLQKNIASGTIYNIAEPNYYSYDDVAEIAEKILNKKTLRIKIPNTILSIYAAILSKITRNRTVVNPDRIKDLMQKHWVCDYKKAEKELGFTTKYNMEDGLRETIEWYKAQKWL